jgi:uncharacterized membrane protein YagU involved in acid resistance
MAANPLSMESGDNTSNGINVTPGVIIDSEPPRYSNVQSRKKPSRRIRHRDIKNENRVKKNKPVTNEITPPGSEITPVVEITHVSHCMCERDYSYFANSRVIIHYIIMIALLELLCVGVFCSVKMYFQAILFGVIIPILGLLIGLSKFLKCK